MLRRALLLSLATPGIGALGGCSLRTTGREQGSIEELSVRVVLNDEFARDFPDVEGSSASCTGVGPPADHYALTLGLRVRDPDSGR